jgi:hypothetical protein
MPKYVLIASDDVDLFKVDGAPFDTRCHIGNMTDELIKEFYSNEDNRILMLGEDTFNRVSKLVHFPIRKAKYKTLFGLPALTLSSGCKVKVQPKWDKWACMSIFKESWITAICPDEPTVSKKFKSYNDEAKNTLRTLIELPKGTIFGFDYETSGLPNKHIEQMNPEYYKLQGRKCEVDKITGKTFQVTGASICSEFRESYYFDFLSIFKSDKAKEFFYDFIEFLTKHSETCWVYNAHFETQVSYILFHIFFIFQDAAAVNYIRGRNMYRQSLKVTTQDLLHIRSWDDAFDDLVDGLNYLLSEAYQVNWDEGTVVQDGLTYIWYESPYFRDLFMPYGEDNYLEAMELAKNSFMNPFLCIPADILGKYCNVDSYSTMELARYMYDKYSKECVDVFTANLRFHVYLNATGNFIDALEFRRQNDVANKASNWGMLLTWQMITKLEIEETEVPNEEPNKGSEILTWCVNNRIYYNKNNKVMLNAILNSVLNWDYEYQVDTNLLKLAFPWDYSYDAIYNQIVSWGGLGNIFSGNNNKFWNSNAWIVSEYGTYDDDLIKKVNGFIEYKKLLRRQEWLWYLSNKIPYWDSDVPEYIKLDTANSTLIDRFVSSDGKPWYESPEFDSYVSQWKIPTTKEHPHYYISGCLNCGAPSGMEYFKNQMINNTTGFLSILSVAWMEYDSYYYGAEFEDKFWNAKFDNFDIWNTIKDWNILPQKLFIDPEGNIVEVTPLFDGLITEIPVELESPVGKIYKASNARGLSEDERRIENHPELIGLRMYELEWEGYIGYSYMYVNKFINKEHMIAAYNCWMKRGVTGYKDFMECNMIGLGQYERYTLSTGKWDWNKICSTKLDACGNKLDEIRPILGLYTWRKFRKILGTYLKNLLVEGSNYTKPEYTEYNGGLVISEYVKDEWSEGWDVTRGHPNWNCMGVHTKRWCLTGDTHILMLDGRTLPIKDMESEVGNYVYSFDVENWRWVPGKIAAWDITGKNMPVYKVKFDTGLEVRATDNHQFMRSDGTYVALKDMKVNDSIMPIKIKCDGNGEKLHDGTKWQYTVATLYGDKMPDNSQYQYHHKDGNHWNNCPENIEILSNYEHHSHHGSELGAKYGGKFTMFRDSNWQSEMGSRKKPGTSYAMSQPRAAAKRRYDFVLYHEETINLYKSGNLNEVTYNSLRSKYGRKWIYWCNVCKFYGGEDKVFELLSSYVGNSRVVSIEFDGYEDVYDIEVDKYHNFAIGDRSVKIRNWRKNGALYTEGVVVHNSSGFHTLFGDSDTKKIITVPKDKLFFYLDISQAEPRTLAYKTGDPLMKGWYESGKDIYIELAKLFNPDVVNATWMTEDQKKARLKELRGLYKILVLAIMYGMGNGSLASMTGKPMNVAKKYKRDFLDAMPKLEEFIEDRMNYPSEENPCVKTILGDYLELYPWDEPRWKRQGINFCIQSFSAIALVAGFENMVRTAIHDGLTFSPIGTVHDSSQMIMDAKFIYNCQAHFDKNYTEYLFNIHGVRYKGDIKLGTNYYDLAKLHIVNENTLELSGTADSINNIIRNLRNAGVNDMKFNIPEDSLIPDYFSSVPKQVARTMGGGAMPDKSSYKVEITFGDDVLQYHRGLVE